MVKLLFHGEVIALHNIIQHCVGAVDVNFKLKYGINDDLYQLRTKGAFYDIFLEKYNFEIGITSVVALSEPLVVGIILSKTVLPLLKSLCGESRRAWSLV